MQHARLIVREDFDSGITGFMMKASPVISYPMVAAEGLLVAHDIIEHQNGPEKIGGIADELEALGAVWLVRGQWGDLRRDGVGSAHSPQRNIAADVGNLFLLLMRGVPLRPVDGYVPRSKFTPADDAFEDMAHLGYLNAIEEWRAAGFDEDYGKPAYSREELESLALMLMRQGWRKAMRRFRPGGPMAANAMFWTIAEAVDDALKYSDLIEGDEYVVSYERNRATCYLAPEFREDREQEYR